MSAHPPLAVYAPPVVVLIIAVAVAAGLGAALLPLLAALALAYLVFPLVHRLETVGIDRRLAVVGALVALTAALATAAAFAVPAVYHDARAFAENFPEHAAGVLDTLREHAAALGIDLAFDRETAVHYLREGLASVSTATVQSATALVVRGVGDLVGVLVAVLNLVLFPVFFYFVLADYERIRDGARRLVPERFSTSVAAWTQRTDEILSGYLRGQLTVALSLAALYAIALALIGLPFALAIGVATGLLSIIPYVGFTLGSLTAITVALATGGGWLMVALIAVAFALVQTFESLVLTPKLVGDKVGLNALETLLALIVGGNVAGLFGMLVAIPAGGLLKQVLAALRDAYLNSELHAADKPPPA